jgi:hypothetical protein
MKFEVGKKYAARDGNSIIEVQSLAPGSNGGLVVYIRHDLVHDRADWIAEDYQPMEEEPDFLDEYCAKRGIDLSKRQDTSLIATESVAWKERAEKAEAALGNEKGNAKRYHAYWHEMGQKVAVVEQKYALAYRRALLAEATIARVCGLVTKRWCVTNEQILAALDGPHASCNWPEEHCERCSSYNKTMRFDTPAKPAPREFWMRDVGGLHVCLWDAPGAFKVVEVCDE